jgi:hypothetical protein
MVFSWQQLRDAIEGPSLQGSQTEALCQRLVELGAIRPAALPQDPSVKPALALAASLGRCGDREAQAIGAAFLGFHPHPVERAGERVIRWAVWPETGGSCDDAGGWSAQAPKASNSVLRCSRPRASAWSK